MGFSSHSLATWGTALGLCIGLAALTAAAQSVENDAHLAIPNPADLSKEDALAIYRDLKPMLDDGYAHAQLEIIRGYQGWAIFNDAPYVSATHGRRYVNSYANRIARNYGTLGPGEELPPGSVLAKDSITIMDDGQSYPAAMFIMEKLEAGTSPETADWRYVMVIPDGSLFGDTLGDEPERVDYCHACHTQVAARDYTFYVPEDYRIAE